MRRNLVAVIAGIAALVVGIMIGQLAATDHGDDPALKRQLAEAEADRDRATLMVHELRDELKVAYRQASAATEPEPGAKPTPAPKPTPKPKTVTVSDGTYLVGDDIPAGTYVGPGGRMDGAPCVAYASREPDDLTTWLRGSNSEGQVIVKVSAGEYFSVQYCRPLALQR